MGEREKDPDLPSDGEVKFVKGKILKSLFFFLMTIIYACRPFFLFHKTMTNWEKINFIVIICTNLLILKFWGAGAFCYIVAGAFFSIGAHPASVHVIAEHAEFARGL